MEDCWHHFCSAELELPSLEVFTCGCHVFAQHSFHCLPVSTACMIARSSAYAYFLELMIGMSQVKMFKRRGAKTHLRRMSFLRRRNLLRLLLPVVKVMLRLPTITMCLLGSNCSSCKIDKHSSCLLSQKSYPRCLASAQWPDLRLTSCVKKPAYFHGSNGSMIGWTQA